MAGPRRTYLPRDPAAAELVRGERRRRRTAATRLAAGVGTLGTLAADDAGTPDTVTVYALRVVPPPAWTCCATTGGRAAARSREHEPNRFPHVPRAAGPRRPRVSRNASGALLPFLRDSARRRTTSDRRDPRRRCVVQAVSSRHADDYRARRVVPGSGCQPPNPRPSSQSSAEVGEGAPSWRRGGTASAQPRGRGQRRPGGGRRPEGSPGLLDLVGRGVVGPRPGQLPGRRRPARSSAPELQVVREPVPGWHAARAPRPPTRSRSRSASGAERTVVRSAAGRTPRPPTSPG